MGTKKDDRCLDKALDDEDLFILMARDPHAPRTIVDWIGRSLGDQPPAKLHEALDRAISMQANYNSVIHHVRNPKISAMMDGRLDPQDKDRFLVNIPRDEVND